MKYGFISGIGAIVLGVSSSAAAQHFPDTGDVVISAERLMGFWHVTQSNEATDDTASMDTIAFLGNPIGLMTIYNFPRIGFDAFVTPGLSLGAAFNYTSASGEGDVDFTMLNFAPRVGYAYMFNETVGIWPRGGLTYSSVGGDGDDVSYLALTAGLDLILAPVEHTAILLGPVLDLGLTGGTDDVDITATSIGMQAGLALWF